MSLKSNGNLTEILPLEFRLILTTNPLLKNFQQILTTLPI